MAEDRKNAENYLRKGKFTYDTKVVTFGSLQDEDGEERPLEWNVLHVSGGHFLLMCTDIVDYRPFNDREDLTTWKRCSLRKWLNEDFFSAAFDREEQAMIDKVETDDGVEDRIFLLSKEESEDFFGMLEGYACGEVYWLRSEMRGNAYVVSRGGMIDHRRKDHSDTGVLPVMWVNLN